MANREPTTEELNNKNQDIVQWPSKAYRVLTVDTDGDENNALNPIPIKFGDSPSLDAFGKLRVSQPETLFDSKQIFDNQPLFWDDQEVSGSGTSSIHSVNKASSDLIVSNLTAGKRVRQTFQRFNYQSGKSLFIMLTGVLGVANIGVIEQAGYFDDDNGVFFDCNKAVLYVVVRSNVTGTPVDDSVAQADWNKDKMDGTGKSGITLDPSKTQIIWLDLEWLGVGRVRMGFVVDGAFICVHHFNHANIEDQVYMSTPNLPLRYSIENDGTGPATVLKTICATVMIEGGSQALGVLRHQDSGDISTMSSGTVYGVFGIRLKSTHLGASIRISNLALISTSVNDSAHWALVFNPTVTGTFTYADVVNSAVQIAKGTNKPTVSGGTEIDGGYFSTALPSSITIPNALKLGSKIDGTPDEIVLIVRPITNNISIEGSLTWRELS